MARGRLTSDIWRAAGRWLPWLAGGALSVQLFFTDFTHASGGRLEGKAFWGRDFVNLWGGGHFLREGGAGAIYDVESYRAFLATLFGPLKPHNYSYPPVTFPIAEAASYLPYWLALAAWLIGTGALFVWAARPWWPRRFGTPWLALLTPAALINIWAGHYGFLVGALFLAGWRSVERDRPVGAGLCFGAMLVKPHLALLVPLALMLRRQWRAIAVAAATALALIALTSAWYGWQPWRDFLLGAGAHQAGLIDAGRSFYGYMSTSLATAVLRFSDDVPLALAAQAILGVAAIAGLVAAARRNVPTADLAMLCATATFLVLPYAFNYDLMAVTVAALRLWADDCATRLEKWAAVSGFVAPQIGLLLAPLDLPAMPLMLAALFAAQLSCALRTSGGRAGRAAAAATH